MKKWLVTASIIVVAGSALCLPVRAEPKNERAPLAPSVEAWWIDIGGRRAFGTIPVVKLARIMRDGEGLRDGCGKKRAIHVANRCSNELRFGSALCHSRHEQ